MGSYLDIVIRTALVYLFMLVALRIFGKRELTQLNAGDAILILLVSNSVQNAMVGTNSSLSGGLIAALALFIINYILKRVMVKSKSLTELIQGKPEILIYKGNVDIQTLLDLGISLDELKEAVREHGIEKINDVKLAILEVNGNLSVIEKKNIKVW